MVEKKNTIVNFTCDCKNFQNFSGQYINRCQQLGDGFDKPCAFLPALFCVLMVAKVARLFPCQQRRLRRVDTVPLFTVMVHVGAVVVFVVVFRILVVVLIAFVAVAVAAVVEVGLKSRQRPRAAREGLSLG